MTDKNTIPVLPEYTQEKQLIRIDGDPITFFKKIKDYFTSNQNFTVYSGKPFSINALLFKDDLYGTFKIKLFYQTSTSPTTFPTTSPTTSTHTTSSTIFSTLPTYYLEVRSKSGDSLVGVKGLQICQALLNGDDPNMIKLKKDITPLPVPKELLVDIHIEDPKTEDILFYLNSEYDDELYDRIKFVHNIYEKFVPNKEVTDRLIKILDYTFFDTSKLVIIDLLLKKTDWIKTLSDSQKTAIRSFIKEKTDRAYDENYLLDKMIQRYANKLKEQIC